MPTPAITKQNLIDLLYAFIRQRPRLEFGNYGDIAAYRAESRSITRDLHHAAHLLRYVELRDSITTDAILSAMRNAYSGRLQLAEDKKGKLYLDYCTGQYWPTEYRRAVAAVMASCVRDWLRHNLPTPTRDSFTQAVRRELPSAIARRWFN